MVRKLIVASAVLSALAAALLAQEGIKTKTKPAAPLAPLKEKAPTANADATATFVASYVAAFNQGDAAALAGHWSEQGVYVDRETGERTEGRAAIQADFQRLFAEKPGARLAMELTSSRQIKPDVAAVEGNATSRLPGEEPTVTSFSALLVKQGNQWLIDNVHESPQAAPPSAREALKEIAWLVGKWQDESETTKVETSVRWGTGESFLVRSFVLQRPDEEEQQGTQVIGWDPQLLQIRSWSFFSDGSFGEGLWSKSGDEWLVKGTHTLADGRLASGTQVIQRDGDDTLFVRLIGREIDGEPLPSGELVKVVRVAAPEASEVGGLRTGTPRPNDTKEVGK